MNSASEKNVSLLIAITYAIVWLCKYDVLSSNFEAENLLIGLIVLSQILMRFSDYCSQTRSFKFTNEAPECAYRFLSWIV